ncbi:hypothetical protein [Synechococcus phage BUCT-ZZ01]|nr:hypothetical protein [Synechococcus phage BUCT-ZZ01]
MFDTTKSVDECLEVLTTSYRRCVDKREAFADFESIIKVHALLRRPLMEDNMEEFVEMFEYVSAKYPDAVDILFDKE